MNRTEEKNIRHGAIVPLIGGFCIAATNTIGTVPSVIFSYKCFFENDKLYLRYLSEKNYNVPYYQIDKLNNTQIRDLSKKYKNLDLIHGILPCAGLSAASSLSKENRKKSPANDWMFKAAEFILGVFKPKVYVFENAPGLFTNTGKHIREKLQNIAIKYDYSITYYRTDTLNHGIPQKRPRTYCIFYKGKKAPLLNKINKHTPNIIDYLNQIPKNVTLQDKYVVHEPYIDDFEIVKFMNEKFGKKWREEMLKVRPHISSYIFLTKKGLLNNFYEWLKNNSDTSPKILKDVKHIIKKTSMGKGYRLSYRHLILDKEFIYTVIGEMMERNIHPVENRRMNIREYLHLMGFPHDFELYNKREYFKIAQNVPVKTSEDIINEIIELIKGNRNISNKRFIMIDNLKKEEIKTKCLF